MKSEHIESICIFGSVARSSADTMSDKDVLIVAQNHQRRAELSLNWKARGWSVSLYTPNRLNAITRAGSLFAQHLKHEGLIVSDNGGWLKRQLQSAAVKSTYQPDAMNSVSLALPTERFSSELPLRHCPIVADLAFVSVRNFGINHLADKGRLTFDYEHLVAETGLNIGLASNEIEMLQSLRLGKSAYRGIKTSCQLKGTVGDLRQLLSKLFPHRPICQINADDPVRQMTSGYARLRDLEAAIVSTLGQHPISGHLQPLGLDKVWNWIVRPQEYAWNVRHFGEGRTNELPLIKQTLTKLNPKQQLIQSGPNSIVL